MPGKDQLRHNKKWKKKENKNLQGKYSKKAIRNMVNQKSNSIKKANRDRAKNKK